MMIAAHNSAEFPKRSRKPHHRIADQPACAGLRKNTALEVDRGEEDHGAQRVVRPNPQALADVWEQQPTEDRDGLPNLQATATNPKAEMQPPEEEQEEEQEEEEQEDEEQEEEEQEEEEQEEEEQEEEEQQEEEQQKEEH